MSAFVVHFLFLSSVARISLRTLTISLTSYAELYDGFVELCTAEIFPRPRRVYSDFHPPCYPSHPGVGVWGGLCVCIFYPSNLSFSRLTFIPPTLCHFYSRLTRFVSPTSATIHTQWPPRIMNIQSAFRQPSPSPSLRAGMMDRRCSVDDGGAKKHPTD